MTPPRMEMRERLRSIANASVPHMSADQQAFWLARKMSADTGRPVSVGTIVRWRNAQHDDLGAVDSRHMDWARARDRANAANDNAWVLRPQSSEAVRLVA